MYNYRKPKIARLTLIDDKADVWVERDVQFGAGNWRSAMNGHHVGDEDSIVDVDQHKGHQAPGPDHQPNGGDLA